MQNFIDLLKDGHPRLAQPEVDLTSIRFADIQYGIRDKALLAFTRDKGVPLSKESFIDICHGRMNVAQVAIMVHAC